MWCTGIPALLPLFLVMASQLGCSTVVRYRGFLLIPQANDSWLVRPERSPMSLLPFRTKAFTLAEVKDTLDFRLSEKMSLSQAA